MRTAAVAATFALVLAGCGGAADPAADATTVHEAPLLRDLKTLTPQVLKASSPDDAEASRLYEAFDLTVRTFPHYRWGPRDTTVPTPAEFEDLAGGQCDSAVEGLRRVARAMGVSAPVVNLNLMLWDPNLQLRGHTIGAVRLAEGWVLFDPLYALVFRTRRTELDDTILSSPQRQAFRSALYDDDHGLTLGSAIQLYGNVDDDRFSARQNDVPWIHARTPWLTVGKSLAVGGVDGSGADLVGAFGSHFDYIGTMYTPIEQDWRFDGLEPGRHYAVEFRLAGYWRPPVELVVDVVDDAGAILEHRATVLDVDRSRLSVSFEARSARTTLVLRPSPAYSAAIVDAVTVVAQTGDGGGAGH